MSLVGLEKKAGFKAMHLIQGVEIVNTLAVFPASRFQYADQMFASVMGDHQYDFPIRLETKASRRVFGRSAWLKSTSKTYIVSYISTSSGSRLH
jgi:hypothetical protein